MCFLFHKENESDLIKKYLGFLIEEYGFVYSQIWDRPDLTTKFVKGNAFIKFVELPQFQEQYLHVNNNGVKREYSGLLDDCYLKSRKMKGNKEQHYWELIAERIKQEIADTGTVFGIKVESL